MRTKKAVIAAIACIAMQIPFVVSKDKENAGVLGSFLMNYIPVELNMNYSGYDEHWWWDNAAHYLAGYSLGALFSTFTDDKETAVKAFVATAVGWEIFEYVSRERPWHINGDGEMDWSFDHAAEDTVLDVIVGAIGAYIAARKP